MTYRFDRFRDGRKMAEGACVEAESIEEAERKAQRLFGVDCRNDTLVCSSGERGELFSEGGRAVRSGNDSGRGIYDKFRVERVDGRSATGEKHHNCRYFVLDLDHDQFASKALLAYAIACSTKFPKLAEDLNVIARGLCGQGAD